MKRSGTLCNPVHGARMQREHDERAKRIAEQALDPLGEVRSEVEIPGSYVRMAWRPRRSGR